MHGHQLPKSNCVRHGRSGISVSKPKEEVWHQAFDWPSASCTALGYTLLLVIPLPLSSRCLLEQLWPAPEDGRGGMWHNAYTLASRQLQPGMVSDHLNPY